MRCRQTLSCIRKQRNLTYNRSVAPLLPLSPAQIMPRIRFLMLGGFLGAGKTTAIARLTRHYVNQGQRVAIVTNDQAYDLVDTHSLRAQGFDVGEVPGACFCCKFDDLIATTAQLTADSAPDVVLTEPVGSCTD